MVRWHRPPPLEPQLLTPETHPLRARHLGRAPALEGGAGAARWPGRLRVGALAGAAGVLLGGLAAGVDGSTGAAGALGVTLSLPGPWIAGAVLVVLTALRGGDGDRRPALRGAVAMTAFLGAGMVAYYSGKQLRGGAVPGPLVAFWLVLASGVGVAGGAATAWMAVRPHGPGALLAALAGWWWVEALVVPSAPAGEAAVAAIGAAAVLARGRARNLGLWLLAAATGAGAAYLVLRALPDVLTRVL